MKIIKLFGYAIVITTLLQFMTGCDDAGGDNTKSLLPFLGGPPTVETVTLYSEASLDGSWSESGSGRTR